MSHKISAMIGTRNEEAKIRFAVTHAMKWADEVVLVDKSSTDRTCEIAASLGAKIVTVPFTRQGHESVSQQVEACSHDWVWIWTSHEVPTRKLIDAGKALVSDDVDLIMVPMHYYSFGVHHDKSPWSGGYQPRLLNRKRVTFTGVAHDPMRAERKAGIPYFHDQYVLHQTHAPVERFMLSHLDYMVNEAQNGTPQEVIARALGQADAYDQVFQSNQELFQQALGWKIYWYGVALHALERANPNVMEQYKARCEEALKEWA